MVSKQNLISQLFEVFAIIEKLTKLVNTYSNKHMYKCSNTLILLPDVIWQKKFSLEYCGFLLTVRHTWKQNESLILLMLIEDNGGILRTVVNRSEYWNFEILTKHEKTNPIELVQIISS